MRAVIINIGIGVLAGIFYGLFMNGLFGSEPVNRLGGVMTLTFLLAVPALGGMISVIIAERWRPMSWGARLSAPWLAVISLFVTAAAVGFYAMICFSLALPIFLGAASIGGLLGGLISDRWQGRTPPALLAVGLTPLLLLPLEQQLPVSTTLRTVETQVVVAADPATVWQQIVRVPPIAAAEQRASLFTLVGIPRPLEATVDSVGVGGQRHGHFAHGLRFDETITVWEPERELAFAIVADTSAVSPGPYADLRLIGSRYFDVGAARYRLEPLADGTTRLHLSSRYRLATAFNVYAVWWTDAIMDDFQRYVLEVVKRRAEGGVIAAGGGQTDAHGTGN